MNNEINPCFSLDGVHFSGNVEKMCQDLMLKQDFAAEEKQNYIAEICSFIELWADKKSTIECLTSGSTGTPKKILLEKKCMIHSAKMTGQFFDLHGNTKALICLPISYIAGRMMLVRAMTLGWEVFVVPPCSSPLEHLEQYVDFAALVPMQLYKSLDQLQKAKKILVGGGEISSSFINKLKNADIPTHIFQSYAMTETITHVAVREVYPKFEDAYTAMNGVIFSTNEDETLDIIAQGLSKDIVKTNDIIRLIDEKHFLWLGRRDNVINSGSIKIHPEETERILYDILECRYFATGIKDDILGEKQVLFIEGDEKDFFSLDSFLNEHFDSIHRPKDVFFLEKFELTHTGKIDRKKTTALYLK